jgi:multiple sugar transport system substrate-binding protein
VSVHWQRQSLEGFESRPLRTLADDFDLLVVDHPGLGEAIRDGALLPLDEVFGDRELAAWQAASVGASYNSYVLGGRPWALPLDAAAQVAVARPDLMEARPASWEQACQAARTHPTTLCLGGPHALLMFSAICLAAGAEPARDDATVRDDAAAGDNRPAEPGRFADHGRFVAEAAGTAALAIMSDLLAQADRELSQANPIGVLDAMAAGGGPAYCPLVYGYLTYQRPLGGEPGSSRLAAFDAPAGPGGTGSVLGGTGVAITRSAVELGAAAALIRTLLSDEVQIGRYAELGGQSSARRAWQHPGADAAGGGFYRATLGTVEQAWVRPRFAGYPEFQSAASEVLRAGLLAGEPHAGLVRRVNELYAAARASSSQDHARDHGARAEGRPA